MDREFIEQALISIPVFLLALTIHEFAHGYAAYKMGDKTALRAGRLTLNPLAHLDPWGLLVFIMSNFRFGWAKPVPIDLSSAADPRRTMMITAFAGPASNLVQAAIFGLAFRALDLNNYQPGDLTDIAASFLFYGILINCILAFFNLIPIAPLDGSKILYGFMPRGKEYLIYQMERYGMFILIAIIASGFFFKFSIIWAVIGPFVEYFVRLFSGVAV